MELVSIDGSRLSLTIAGYQFPGMVGSGPHDWDANWLNVAGRFELSDGRRHSFTDPCLTTWEAQSLAEWLNGVALGEINSRPDTDEPDLVFFTEPCLAFSLVEAGVSHVGLRVYLSLEAGPPFVMAGKAGVFENYLSLTVSTSSLEQAAGAWGQELLLFPLRS